MSETGLTAITLAAECILPAESVRYLAGVCRVFAEDLVPDLAGKLKGEKFNQNG